jgi:hypothetical protein
MRTVAPEPKQRAARWRQASVLATRPHWALVKRASPTLSIETQRILRYGRTSRRSSTGDFYAPPADRPLMNSPINRQKVLFWLPLVGYWLLAILTVFHSQPPWMVMILGSPLVFVAFAINYRARQTTTTR